MSAADRVGQGTSFGRARNARLSERGRAKRIAEGAMPEYELQRFPLDRVCPSPMNPRRNFGDLAAFGEELRKRQLAACVAVSRSPYLELFPEHGDRIPEQIEIVLLNGERRYRAALEVGLDALDFVVRDDLATSRSEFVDNLLKENLDREDFDVIERARGVQQLVAECKDQVEAAERLRRDKSWVTNQLTLLTLPDHIQALLSAGEMPERHGRALGRILKREPGLDADELLAHWNQIKADEVREKLERKQLLSEAAERRRLSMDNRPESSTQAAPDGSAEASRLSTDNPTTSGTAPSPAVAMTAVKQMSAASEQRVSELSMDNSDTPAPPMARAETAVPSVPHQGVEAPPDQQDAATPARPATVVLQLDPFDALKTARTLQSALDARQVSHLISVLLTGGPSSEELAESLSWQLTPGELDRVTKLLQERVASSTS